MRSNSHPERRSFLPVEARHATPHSTLFLFFNVVYFLPLLGLLLFNYSEGGTLDAADLDTATFLRITLLYALGCGAFLLGTRFDLLRVWADETTIRRNGIRLFTASRSFQILCLIVVVALLLSKVLLVPTGVYSEYAFDTENMTGGIWSFSMFCAESVLFFSIALLFSRSRHNVAWFIFLTAINATNLLHGTRLFSMIAGVVFCFYLYIRGRFNWRLAILAPIVLLAVGYVVFITRSDVFIDQQTFSIAKLISPVMYEAIFSQLSLIQAVRSPHLWTPFGSPLHFLSDVFYFVTPRLLLPQKDQLLFIDQFSDLSPLGGFSGYAQGLLYFGVAFPVFYFVLGTVGAWLWRRAKDSSFWSVMYVYFACDFLFRVMRDGYVIPVKMLINALTILALVLLAEHAQLLVDGAQLSRPAILPDTGSPP
jgi:hypothetical protein